MTMCCKEAAGSTCEYNAKNSGLAIPNGGLNETQR
jgi:hypothetical protein